MRTTSDAGKRPGHEAIRQGLAGNELHDDEGRPIGVAQLVDTGDVGVAQRGQDAGFATEPFEIVLVEQMRVDEFQRDVALESAVTRAIDDAHATLAERLEEFVRPQSTAGGDGYGAQGVMGRGLATRGL